MSVSDSMRTGSRQPRRVLEVLLVALLAFVAGRVVGPNRSRGDRAAARTIVATLAENAGAGSGRLLRETSYLLDFAGDHSLNAATVTERSADGRALYTVNLRLASGAEQSVEVAGPPGGLQIEMDDMTGDHVPNDLILRPALFSLLPTILVNDGHDHFAVVVSGADSGSCSAPENLGSAGHNSQTFAFLGSSGFKAIHLSGGRRMLTPQPRRTLLASFVQSFGCHAKRGCHLDRAPPASAVV